MGIRKADERTRIAFLLITSERSEVRTRCATVRVRELGGLSSYERHRPNTASPPSRSSERDLVQDDFGGSLIASPQLQKSLHRRGRVVLVVVVRVGDDGPALFEKAIHKASPPQ